MISVDVDAGCKVKFFNSKVVTKTPESSLRLVKVSHYYDVFSISVVEFIDQQRNDNDPLLFSIKLFGKDGNDMKFYEQLTTMVPSDCNCTLYAIYLCEVVMKQANTLFIHLNPEKNDSIEDIRIKHVI